MGEFKNRINVTINDQHFTIIGEDSPEHIRYVAHLVDEKNARIRSKISRFRYNSKSDFNICEYYA